MMRSEAVELELFTNRFTAIALETGEMLRRTAISTNIKERLDYSCALLDPNGDLVVNAPHIPVHLGAMSLCVKGVARELVIREGDILITNHPAYGGSHLPDVTVVTPVHFRDRLIGYVASRSHHAEIGGRRPGSMPPDATRLSEEGVIIAPRYLGRNHKPDWTDIERLLTGGEYPTRNISDNMADLRAAVAANHHGSRALLQLVERFGADTVVQRMQGLKSRARERMKATLAHFPEGVYKAEEFLDDGWPLRVRIEIRNDSARIDFAGTGDMHPGNLNAGPAIVHAVVIYVLRILAAGERPPLPLNSGLLEAVQLHIPAATILRPDSPAEDYPAVVGGNIETSQRLVNLLLKALGLAASSAGTMNNVLFGNERFGYYETVCGGSGATDSADGAHAVHTHMTNTRITDPEVLEHRYPVRLEEFSVRRGSGGAGCHRGGDGVVRRLRFLEPVSLSVLTQNRVRGPFGLQGGEPGAPGRQHIVRTDGTTEELSHIDASEMNPGDQFILETPGGGGFGKPDHDVS